MQRSLTLGALALLFAGTAMAQTSAPRPRPTIMTPPGAQKPVSNIPLNQRVIFTPRFLNIEELKKESPIFIGKLLNAPFILSAATPDAPGRGNVKFDNNAQIFVANPLPPGSGGVATVRNKAPASGSAPPEGAVRLTLTAQPDQLFAIDCVLTINGKDGSYVRHEIIGASSNSRGVTYLKKGHARFDLRGATPKSDLTLYLYPNNNVGNDAWGAPKTAESDTLEFYGCQITPTS